MQFCSSNGKYLTSMAHELRKMTIDSHVTLPFDVTMTLVLIEDLYDDTSALHAVTAQPLYDVWPGGAMVKTSACGSCPFLLPFWNRCFITTCGSTGPERVRLLAVPLIGIDRGQVVHTHVPPSLSSITWYTGNMAGRHNGWEGNRRSGVVLSIHNSHKWFIHLRVQGLSKGDEQPIYTLHGLMEYEWYSLRYPLL